MAAGSSGIYELAGAISASEEAIEKDVCLKKSVEAGGEGKREISNQKKVVNMSHRHFKLAA